MGCHALPLPPHHHRQHPQNHQSLINIIVGVSHHESSLKLGERDGEGGIHPSKQGTLSFVVSAAAVAFPACIFAWMLYYYFSPFFHYFFLLSSSILSFRERGGDSIVSFFGGLENIYKKTTDKKQTHTKTKKYYKRILRTQASKLKVRWGKGGEGKQLATSSMKMAATACCHPEKYKIMSTWSLGDARMRSGAMKHR